MRHNIKYSVVCEKGFVREINQDAVFADVDGYNGVFCVADGMGGHSKGELASQIIVSEVKEVWEKMRANKAQNDFRTVFDTFKNTLKKTNRIIFETLNKDSICGSTVSLLIIYNFCYGIINVGDSRVYIYDKHSFFQATEDDVWENLSSQKGRDYSELIKSSEYGQLTNSIGTTFDMRDKYSIHKIQGWYNFLLCSDGVYKSCDGEKIKRIIKKNKNNPVGITNYISEEVCKNGAKDNYSMINIWI